MILSYFSAFKTAFPVCTVATMSLTVNLKNVGLLYLKFPFSFHLTSPTLPPVSLGFTESCLMDAVPNKAEEDMRNGLWLHTVGIRVNVLDGNSC